MKKLSETNSKGQLLVLIALLMAVLLGAASLALDLGRAYGVKARLDAAVDAASYEAAKAVGESSDIDKAREVASAYFRANYPAGYLGADPGAPTVEAVREGSGVWRVSVSARARMPVFFAALLGWQDLDIGAASESQRRTLDMVLVMDTSLSLTSVFDTVKTDAKAYLDRFDSSGDRVGLVAFSTGAYPVVSICGDYPNSVQNPLPESSLNCPRGFLKMAVREAIDSLTSNSHTNSEEGMKKALDQLNSLLPAARSLKRAIVFFSDGAPNTFNGNFTLSTGEKVAGNLFSELTSSAGSHRIYDQALYRDNNGAVYDNVASLPSSGTDTTGTVPLASFNDKRTFSGNSDAASFNCDANKAARNMVENVANLARSQGITVYTVGYGKWLDDSEFVSADCSTHYEKGSIILKRLANSKESDTYLSSQPSGIYCHAETIDQLKPCFDTIAQAIVHISK